MLESKDPAIKLFGMKIPLSKVVEAAEEEEDVIFAEKSNKEMKNQNETLTDQSEKDKTLKKPTKILPCPRCNSMETKFCYYNNYNVNQPRHFCKACQRYWTSGGTMRSVPIGAGRRKNQSNSSSSAHYHHVTISETNGPVVSFNLGDDWIAFREFLGRTRGILVFTRFTHIGTFQCCSSSPSSSPNYSPKTTLGKHSRDEGETMQRKKRNGNVLVPKTLRIDDPNEAAKSSIWTTLGIKNEVMFKGFDSKKEVKINKEESETSLVLCANPAALSRSVNFHEQM